MAQSGIDIIRKKIKGQLNKHGVRGGMLGVGMIVIKQEDDFIKDLADVVSRRIADIAKEVDLVPIVFDVLMNNGHLPSKHDLARRIVGEIEKQT